MLLFDSHKYIVHAAFVGEKDQLRPGAILDFFQDEASIHANKLKIGYKDLIKKDILWVVNYQEIDIKGKLPEYCDEIEVSTWPIEKKRLEYIREYEIKDESGNVVVTGVSSWFTITNSTRKLVKDDSVQFDGEYREYSNYPNFRRKKLDLKCDNPIDTFEYKVLYTDLDHNEHMNNAKYLELIYNLHKGFKLDNIKKICISFNHEVKLGEIIKVSYYKNEDNDSCYIGMVNDINCFEALIKEK